MSEREALTAACLANPHENTPRLLLADFLEEFGTSDQDAARVEWIRLTCAKNRCDWMEKSGRRLRGEPYWLMANWPRLWPNLWSMVPKGIAHSPAWGRLTTRGLTINVSVNLRDTRTRSNSHTRSRVHISCSRGLTCSVTCWLPYASQTGPVAARDEPLAILSVTNRWALRETGREARNDGSHYYNYYTDNALHTRFDKRGLVGVWDLLEGYEESTRNYKAYPEQSPNEHDLQRPFYVALEIAFTRWCREQAQGSTHAGT